VWKNVPAITRSPSAETATELMKYFPPLGEIFQTGILVLAWGWDARTEGEFMVGN
jgi:hypothetical protein